MEGYVFSTVQPDSNSESGSEYETDSSEELLSSNVGVQYKALTITDEERLEDYTKAKTYERVRNKYFTKPTITKFIVVDSHNYAQSSSFDSSNYTVKFNLEDTSGGSTVSTAYDVYRDVIGFRLTNANIRKSPFNVNTTNNVIHYKVGGGSDEFTATIRPGLYTVTELASALSSTSPGTLAHYTTYPTSGSPGTISATFRTSTSTLTNSNNGLTYELTHSAGAFHILWDKNSVTRGAAKLFGFLPKTTDSASRLISDKTPDLSQHHVDIVIPEIPPIACKRNSAGRDIVDRIPLQVSSGEYQYYFNTDTKHHYQNFFYPITLSQLTIQLYAENNEFYDCNKTDHSFEFEIMMLKHDG
jgi:hypothetical protein